MLEALEGIKSYRMVNLSLCTDCEASALRLGGYSHRERWTRTRPKNFALQDHARGLDSV